MVIGFYRLSGRAITGTRLDMKNRVLREMESNSATLKVTDEARIVGQTGLAWLLALLVFQVGLLLGLG